MQIDQAIFTSMERQGRAGYHIVARSPGVSENEATSLTKWCPSHGSLALDDSNQVSVNFFPLSSGRFALSRSCLGRPEFSGRGGRQVYTRAILLDIDALRRSGFRPFLIYRDALALGHLHFRADPPAVLPTLELSTYHQTRADEAWAATARNLGLPLFDSIVNQLASGQPIVVPYPGDRMALTESLLSQLETETLLSTSFATSLQPSNVRPFVLHVVPPTAARR